MHSPPA